jgi:hypothetical protein
VLLKTREQAMLEDILDSVKKWLREQHSVEKFAVTLEWSEVEDIPSFCLN